MRYRERIPSGQKHRKKFGIPNHVPMKMKQFIPNSKLFFDRSGHSLHGLEQNFKPLDQPELSKISLELEIKLLQVFPMFLPTG